MNSRQALHRILDANLNRAREGVRVCEELARLGFGDPSLTGRCQRFRYRLEAAARRFPRGRLIRARSAASDVGRPSRRGPIRRHRRAADLLSANIRRVQEALRVVEEVSRLLSPGLARRWGELRFQSYTLEKDLLRPLPAVRHR